MLVLAIDPGRDKCGVALVSEDGSPRHLQVVSRSELASAVAALVRDHRPTHVVIGSGTTSDDVVGLVRPLIPGLPVALQDEEGTTLEGRELWLDHVRGLLGFFPRALRALFAPAELDAWAAVAAARRWLRSRG